MRNDAPSHHHKSSADENDRGVFDPAFNRRSRRRGRHNPRTKRIVTAALAIAVATIATGAVTMAIDMRER
jgi:hypothetical protein